MQLRDNRAVIENHKPCLKCLLKLRFNSRLIAIPLEITTCYCDTECYYNANIILLRSVLESDYLSESINQ